MKMTKLILGELATNCYLVETGNGTACAFDIGNGAEKVLRFLEYNHLKLTHIFLTHGHYDHVAGVEEVRQATGAEVWIHEKDAVMLKSSQANLAWQLTEEQYQPVKDYHTFQDGQEFKCGTLHMKAMHTPGHTPGGVCYLTEELVMFSGDTLFRGSMGRTDLGGNVQDMQDSLRKLSALQENYQIYPGHFNETTLDFEKEHNPYLRRSL